MHIGAIFPQSEIGADPIAVRDIAQAAEDLGYHHLLAFEHVILPGPPEYRGYAGAATAEQPFHEPLVLFGYLAALTQRIELVTDVLVLPQRQTVLVAKQAAEVDVLSGGRLRLGIGVGWIPNEFAALGADYSNRGTRSEEQIVVLRALWTEPVVTFRGRWHQIEAAGISPLPVQRPIPIWIGGRVEATLRRVARMGDGWFPLDEHPDDQAREKVERLRMYTVEAGRDPTAVGIEGFLSVSAVPRERWAKHAEGWRTIGATHLAVSTIGAGFASPQQHIDALQQVKEVLRP
ncbi:MAG TPA: LLM class F420-dependent oxidoreductase [Thermomicrobiales bacterium]|nr:LLM class F420-dependent oxidoreductase [Thermomicrobiales bacterium]